MKHDHESVRGGGGYFDMSGAKRNWAEYNGWIYDFEFKSVKKKSELWIEVFDQKFANEYG